MLQMTVGVSLRRWRAVVQVLELIRCADRQLLSMWPLSRELTAKYDSDASTCSSFSWMFSCTAVNAATGFFAAAVAVLLALTG
jgi:hypothetical protein